MAKIKFLKIFFTFRFSAIKTPFPTQIPRANNNYNKYLTVSELAGKIQDYENLRSARVVIAIIKGN